MIGLEVIYNIWMIFFIGIYVLVTRVYVDKMIVYNSESGFLVEFYSFYSGWGNIFVFNVLNLCVSL